MRFALFVICGYSIQSGFLFLQVISNEDQEASPTRSMCLRVGVPSRIIPISAENSSFLQP